MIHSHSTVFWCSAWNGRFYVFNAVKPIFNSILLHNKIFISNSFSFSFFILSPLILSYLILSYLILSYLILSYLILSYLILSYLLLSYLILSYRIVSYLILSYFVLSFFLFSFQEHPTVHIRLSGQDCIRGIWYSRIVPFWCLFGPILTYSCLMLFPPLFRS